MISPADATDYVQFAATGKNLFRERGTKVRWPWWSVRKASKMRSDHLEVLVCSQQGKTIFATGARVIGALRDFGVHPERWTVSVKNAISVVRPNLGLFDDKQDLRGTAVAGFDAEWIHASVTDPFVVWRVPALS